jgi:transposase
MHSQLLVGNQSMKGYPKEMVNDIEKQNEKLLKSLSEQIKTVDKLLKEWLQEDEELQRKARLIQSVPGIGQQTAAFLLIVMQFILR